MEKSTVFETNKSSNVKIKGKKYSLFITKELFVEDNSF
jgi:hypothetical protein